MPQIHEREKLVHLAEIELGKALLKVSENLTAAEYLRVLANVFGDAISTIAKYEIRQERHGDEDTPGGWASTPESEKVPTKEQGSDDPVCPGCGCDGIKDRVDTDMPKGGFWCPVCEGRFTHVCTRELFEAADKARSVLMEFEESTEEVR